MTATKTPPGTSPRAKSNSPTKSPSPIEASTEPQAPQGPHVETQPALDVAAEGDVDDDEFDPQEYDLASNASTSIRSSILEHEYESGRRYHHYRHGRYPLPNDDMEQGRDAMKHAIHLEACDGELVNAPVGSHPQRILDLATGTGLWAIDVADKYPSAVITGLDLSPIQPEWIPPNVRFIVDDIEDEWVESEPYDLIHMRHSCAYLKDVDKLLKRCYDNLKPGGWCEFSDFGGHALCDDGTMPADYPVNEALAFMRKSMAQNGCNTLVANEHEANFRRAGFKNVKCRIIKTPIGPWPKDKTQRLIGMYFREVMHGLVTALGSKVFKNVMTEAEIEVFLVHVRKSLNDVRIHSYFNFITWWGQRED